MAPELIRQVLSAAALFGWLARGRSTVELTDVNEESPWPGRHPAIRGDQRIACTLASHTARQTIHVDDGGFGGRPPHVRNRAEVFGAGTCAFASLLVGRKEGLANGDCAFGVAESRCPDPSAVTTTPGPKENGSTDNCENSLHANTWILKAI